MRDAVASVNPMHNRLVDWAAWLTSGGQANGYPTKSVLHQSWMPPAPGATPSMRTSIGRSTARERALHSDIGSLSVRLQNTLVVVYVMRAKPDEQVRLLECQPATVRARVREACRLLAIMAER